MPGTTERYDLSGLSDGEISRGRRRGRWAFLGFGLFVAIVVVAFAIARLSSGRSPSYLEATFFGVGTLMLVVSVLVVRAIKPGACALELDASGILFEFTKGPPLRLTWSDPGFRLFLYRSSPASSNSPDSTLQYVTSRPYGLPVTPLTLPAFERLLTLASASGSRPREARQAKGWTLYELGPVP